jgi:hypothetical protein
VIKLIRAFISANSGENLDLEEFEDEKDEDEELFIKLN